MYDCIRAVDLYKKSVDDRKWKRQWIYLIF